MRSPTLSSRAVSRHTLSDASRGSYGGQLSIGVAGAAECRRLRVLLTARRSPGSPQPKAESWKLPMSCASRPSTSTVYDPAPSSTSSVDAVPWPSIVQLSSLLASGSPIPPLDCSGQPSKRESFVSKLVKAWHVLSVSVHGSRTLSVYSASLPSVPIGDLVSVSQMPLRTAHPECSSFS